MSVIYCDLDIFSHIQHINIIDHYGNKTTVSADISMMANYISELCHQQNINNVHLFRNTKYVQGIANDIYQLYSLKYSNQDLNIEVN